MTPSANSPARISSLTLTDTLVRAMEDAGAQDFTRCVVLVMDDSGIHRALYSNARSEPEMFGMIAMAGEGFTDNILEEDGDD